MKKWPSYRGGRLTGGRLERFYCILNIWAHPGRTITTLILLRKLYIILEKITKGLRAGHNYGQIAIGPCLSGLVLTFIILRLKNEIVVNVRH